MADRNENLFGTEKVVVPSVISF